MSQQRKGSSGGAYGKGARPKQRNGCSASANSRDQADGDTSAGLPWMCAVCNDAVNEGEHAIECHRCKHWSHKQCTDLNEAEFRVLQRGCENLLWHCNQCVKEGASTNTRATSTDVKLDMIVKMFEEMVKRLERLEIAHTGKSLDDKINEAVRKEVKEIMEENDEQERRKPFLIIANIPESNRRVEDDRKAEDRDRVREVLRRTELDDGELNEITIEARLGKEAREGRMRMIKIKINNPQTKAKILRNGRNVNHKDCPVANRIYINKDLTQKQRQQGKILRDELREKRETCRDKRWGIRNEKVVELATDGPARDNGGEVKN